MIKRHHYIFILIILISGLIFQLRSYFNKPSPDAVLNKTAVETPSPVVDSVKLEIDGKKVIGLTPGKEKDEIQNIKVANYVSSEWQQNLEDTLRAQGGSSIKEIKLTKVDSFVWSQDGIALYVESVIVNLRNDKNVSSTFRVLVDAQNGKILKNWDQPVIDTINPKDRFRIKVDPRYHAD